MDFIEFEIHTEKPTNFWTVQNALREIQHLPADVNPYVEPLNKGDGGAATEFVFRIQDPEQFASVKELLQQFECKIPLDCPATLTAIEIALDAYDAGAQQVALFYKFATHLVSENHRIYRDYKGSPQAIPANFDSLVRHLEKGYQIGIGHKGDDYYQHGYWKTTDNGGKPLLKSEYRARFEIRLRGKGLPFHTFEEWEGFSFTSLSKFFRFRKVKSDLAMLPQCIADASVQIGERRTHNLSNGDIRRRLHSTATQADTKLNARALDALRELSRRWKAQPKQGINKLVCRNTGEIEPANPHECSKEGARSNNYIINNLNNTDTRHHQDKETHSTGRHAATIRPPDTLRASRLNDDSGDGELMTPEMLRISRLMEIDDGT